MKIVLVDDDADIRLIAGAALERLGGHAVRPVSSGIEALAALEQEDADAVLTDVRMPDMSGTELLQRLRSSDRFGAIPVVFLTGVADPAKLDGLVAAGASGVIRKPFDPEKLPGELERLVRCPMQETPK